MKFRDTEAPSKNEVAISYICTLSMHKNNFHLFYAPPSNSVHMGLVYNDIH